MKRIVLVLAATVAGLPAETVTWSATGTVSGAGGSFPASGIAPGQTVEVRFSYDSEAGFTQLKDVLGTVELDYNDRVNLTLQVDIGDRSWVGSVFSANPGAPRTLFTRDHALFAGELVEVTLTEEDNGFFAAFPESLGGGRDSVTLSFSAAGMNFLNGGITASKIDPGQVTAASGRIATGAGASRQEIAFTIDPASLVVEGDGAAVTAPALQIAVDAATVELRWPTEQGAAYTVQVSSDLREFGWSDFLHVSGDGSVAVRSFSILGGREFYRVVVAGP